LLALFVLSLVVTETDAEECGAGNWDRQPPVATTTPYSYLPHLLFLSLSHP
jgi:hypothetical protein